MSEIRNKLEQRLGWLVLALLLFGCLLVLRPFLSALLWAAILSFTTWPLYRRLLGWLRGRKTLAALAITLGMIAVTLLPLVVVGVTLADSVKELTAATQRWLDSGPPAPPAWLPKLPVVGGMIAETWQELAADSAKLVAEARKLVEPVGSGLLRVGVLVGSGMVQLTLSIFITFFLLRRGAEVVEILSASIARIAGERGRHLLTVAGDTVRGVVYGILGTALVQAVMAGVGFLIAGVPGAALLALLTFFLSIVPMGPPLVWLPAALWLFHEDRTGWGIFMLIWGAGVSTVDNFVKPWLISQGSAMPFLLVLFGVLGGALAFGFIGVFIGPTLLAVGHRLVAEWIATQRRKNEQPAPGAG